MSGQPPRKVPRIISRTKSRGRAVETSTEGDSKPSVGQEALVKELSKEKHVVKDGCLVAVQHIEKGAVHGVLGATPTHGGRRVVIDVPLQDPELQPYTENPLPGVADQIESYPCQFCPDMIFLTRYGLERHAKQIHPEQFNEVTAEIEKIQKEWERREKERNRLKEKAIIAKARHESYAYTAVRYVQEGRPVHIDEHTSRPGPERFEACKICNLLINIRHPTAMDHHLGAHKKNEELKQQLLEAYGEETVNRLTCHECRLVFTDPNKLDQHMVQTHQRRRKFICKYCGQLCLSMSSLNAHKADVHSIVTNSNTAQARNIQVQAMKQAQKRSRVVPQSYGKDNNFSKLYRLAHEDSVCSTECAECGLRLVRPSLLVRHMLRVHNKASFNCDIKTRGLPDFRIEVLNTKIFWWCCSQRFADRHDFIFHRKQEHLETTIQMIDGKTNLQEPEDREYAEKPQETLLLQPGSSSYNADLVHDHDTTYQVMLPEGIDDNGQILVILRDGEEDKEAYIDGRDLAEMHEEIHEEPIQEEIVDADGLEYGEHLTQEQYDQLREQYGDNLDEMLVYNYEEINNDEILEEEHIIEEGVAEDSHHHQAHLTKQGEDLTCEEIFE